MKTKGKELITDLARETGKQLNAWSAVEAHAKRQLDATRGTEVNGDFAELHFSGASVKGVVKVGNVVMKIES